LRLTWSASEVGRGLGRSADFVFQSQPQIFQNQAKPAQDSAKLFKEKAWASLDFWLEAERKLFVASGPRAA
jgi:hypothetical protein